LSGEGFQAYLDPERWSRMSILNVARSGFFSSDRAIRSIATEIWKVKPVRIELRELSGEDMKFNAPQRALTEAGRLGTPLLPQ
jgi:hypothetical protein